MLEIIIIVALTLLNGVFAMSELAVVSSRKARLQHMADQDVGGTRTALRLIDDPGRFLSTVQIGITMVGVVAGAYGGVTLGQRFGSWLDTFPVLAGYGEVVRYAAVIIAITYLSIVLGELIPKRIALRAPERTASLISEDARIMAEEGQITGETQRREAEEGRIKDEGRRRSTETARCAAEEARQAQERVRQLREEARQFAEDARFHAEQRGSRRSGRAAADEQRQLLEEMRETVRLYEALLARSG